MLASSTQEVSDGLQIGAGESRKGVGRLSPLSFPLGWVSSDACSESQEGVMEGRGSSSMFLLYVSHQQYLAAFQGRHRFLVSSS